MSNEEEKTTGLVPSPSSVLSCVGSTSLAQRGMQDWLAAEEAEQWLKKGLEFSAQGLHEEAALWYRKAADQGDTDAQFQLALMYLEGQGVPRDLQQFISWCRKSADQGYIQAQIQLGFIYDEGGEVAELQDYTQAAYWYLKIATTSDYSDADEFQRRLGQMYENGLGVPKDIEQSIYWYRKAAERGNEAAKAALATLRQQITRKG